MTDEGSPSEGGSSGNGEAPDLGQFGSHGTFKSGDNPDNTRSGDSSDDG